MGTSIKMRIGKLGYPTIQIGDEKLILLHSLYEPTTESSKIVDSWEIPENPKHILVVGLGLGYHVIECLRRHQESIEKLVVVECYPEIVKLSILHFPQIFTDERIVILQPKTELEFQEMFQQYQGGTLCLHMPSISVIPYPRLRTLFQEIHVIKTSESSSREILYSNWMHNHALLASKFILSNKHNMWGGVPGVLIAAGPSLSEVLPFLKSFQDKGAIILAVTRVMKILNEHKIVPDAYVVTESNEIIASHFDFSNSLNLIPPLFALPTVHPNTIRTYPGDVHFVLQSGTDYVEQFARKHHYDLFATGGSVATLILSLLYYFGCNPIIFAGQDLAYMDGKSHADTNGVVDQPHLQSYSYQVRSVTGDNIETTVSWNSFRHFIERFIATHPDRTYINVSRGAHIQGTSYVPVEDIISNA